MMAGVEDSLNYLRWLLGLLVNRNFVLPLGIALGLLIGPAASWTAALTLPALALVMTAAASQVPSSTLLPPGRILRPTALALLLSYLLNGGVTLLLARWLTPQPDLWAGFVLVAVAPPGVAVLPFSAILQGDTTLALLGTVGTYLAALAITPVLVLLLLGPSLVQPTRLLLILLELVAAPLLLSRLLRRPALYRYAERWWGPAVNWGLGMIVFAVIAINRDLLLRRPQVLLLTLIVSLVAVFGAGLVAEFLLGMLAVERGERISLALFAAIKNSIFAAATALALLSQDASLPGAVVSAVIVLYLIWLGARHRA